METIENTEFKQELSENKLYWVITDKTKKDLANTKLAIGKQFVTDWMTPEKAKKEAKKPSTETLFATMIAISKATYEQLSLTKKSK